MTNLTIRDIQVCTLVLSPNIDLPLFYRTANAHRSHASPSSEASSIIKRVMTQRACCCVCLWFRLFMNCGMHDHLPALLPDASTKQDERATPPQSDTLVESSPSNLISLSSKHMLIASRLVLELRLPLAFPWSSSIA